MASAPCSANTRLHRAEFTSSSLASGTPLLLSSVLAGLSRARVGYLRHQAHLGLSSYCFRPKQLESGAGFVWELSLTEVKPWPEPTDKSRRTTGPSTSSLSYICSPALWLGGDPRRAVPLPVPSLWAASMPAGAGSSKCSSRLQRGCCWASALSQPAPVTAALTGTVRHGTRNPESDPTWKCSNHLYIDTFNWKLLCANCVNRINCIRSNYDIAGTSARNLGKN